MKQCQHKTSNSIIGQHINVARKYSANDSIHVYGDYSHTFSIGLTLVITHYLLCVRNIDQREPNKTKQKKEKKPLGISEYILVVRIFSHAVTHKWNMLAIKTKWKSNFIQLFTRYIAVSMATEAISHELDDDDDDYYYHNIRGRATGRKLHTKQCCRRNRKWCA